MENLNLFESFEITVNKYGGVGLGSVNHYKNIVLFYKKGGDGVLNTIVVCSATGKSTALLECIFEALKIKFQTGGKDKFAEIVLTTLFNQFKFEHLKLVEELFDGEKEDESYAKESIDFYFNNLLEIIKNPKEVFNLENKNSEYTRQKAIILGFGELVSSSIFSHYFNYKGIKNKWLDSRKFIKTKNPENNSGTPHDHSNAEVDMKQTQKAINELFPGVLESFPLVVCQGYIGSDALSGEDTLIGKNGSDYTASVAGVCVGAEYVGFWKDSILKEKDPSKYPNAKSIFHCTPGEYNVLYEENGDGPVRPDSITLLGDHNIPSKVKSFDVPFGKPTIIKN